MVRRWPSPIDFIEAAGAIVFFAFLRLLPLDAASGLGGFLGRVIGPRLGITKRARANLRLAMPELSPQAIERIIRDMWDNLGRVSAEYPHLRKFDAYKENGRVEIVDRGNIVARVAGRRYIFFSAHCGNWEIGARTATQAGFAVTAIYRAANNPIIDRLIIWARGTEGGEFAPKGTVAAHKAIASLREGRELCMLIDQKMNDGIAVPFFGHEAMTAPGLAQLALRFDCIVVPTHVVRVKGAHFQMILEPPLPLPRSGDTAADRLALMTKVNETVEGWIREHPAQWLWLHRRWPD